MDKQKQIEEMTKETCWQQIYPYGDDRPFCFLTHGVCKCCYDNQCDHYEVCERIYNAGYRKIPENAVIMTETERITMCVEQWDKGYNQARKETAEKFAERLKEMAYQSTDWSHGEHPMVVEVDYIDEILEEITEG